MQHKRADKKRQQDNGEFVDEIPETECDMNKMLSNN